VGSERDYQVKTDRISRDDVVIPEEYSALLMGPEGFDILIPKEDENGNVPDEAAFLMGVAIRMSKDEAWVNEMFDWLNAYVQEGNGEDKEEAAGE
jgi:hypothetical protein